MVDVNAIGARIKEAREKKGLTQEQLAKILHVGRGQVSMWERGERDLKTGTVIALAENLNVTCDYILTGIDTKNRDIAKETGLSNASIEILRHWKKIGDDCNLLDRLIDQFSVIEAQVYYARFFESQKLVEEYKATGLDAEHPLDFWINRMIDRDISPREAMRINEIAITAAEIHADNDLSDDDKTGEIDYEIYEFLKDNANYLLYRFLEEIKAGVTGSKIKIKPE